MDNSNIALSLRRTYATVAYVCARACENPPLYYCHDADILVCIFGLSILLRSPLCSREWSPRSSTRFESAPRPSSTLRLCSNCQWREREENRHEAGETNRFTTMGTSRRARRRGPVGSWRVFFSTGRLSVSRLTRTREREKGY